MILKRACFFPDQSLSDNGTDDGRAGDGAEVAGVDVGVGVIGQDPVVVVAEAVAVGGVTVEVEATGTESGLTLCFAEQGLATEAEGGGIDGVVLSGCGEDEPEARRLMGERCGEEHAGEKLADTMGLRGGEAEAEVGRVVG